MLQKRVISKTASSNVVIKKDKIICYGKTYDYRITKTKEWKWGKTSYILYIRFSTKPYRAMAHQDYSISQSTLLYQVKNYYFQYIKK